MTRLDYGRLLKPLSSLGAPSRYTTERPCRPIHKIHTIRLPGFLTLRIASLPLATQSNRATSHQARHRRTLALRTAALLSLYIGSVNLTRTQPCWIPVLRAVEDLQSWRRASACDLVIKTCLTEARTRTSRVSSGSGMITHLLTGCAMGLDGAPQRLIHTRYLQFYLPSGPPPFSMHLVKNFYLFNSRSSI